jgi:hypothetical protein
MPDVSGSVFLRVRSLIVVAGQEIHQNHHGAEDYVRRVLASRSVLSCQHFAGSDCFHRDNLLCPRERVYRTKADTMATVLAPTAESLDSPCGTGL